LATIVYNLFLVLYSLGIRIVALFNPKARLWLAGRKGILKRIKSTIPPNTRKLVWMHAASLGEFEQGRPLIEKIKWHDPEVKILLTFYSPSGYEVKKDYSGADYIFYLPMDGASHAKEFINWVKPELVLWVKYEFWYHYLNELHKQKVPLLLVSGTFREDQPFFQSYGKFWKKMLACFSHIFVQNEESKLLLESINVNSNVSVSGDTRFDRVISIAGSFDPVPLVEKFCEGHRVIVAGSTWEDDEVELIHFAKANPGIRFVIAPHEIDKESIRDVRKEFPKAILYSELVAGKPMADANCLIIDNVGMLSRLYYYAYIAYVGGGFGEDGIHNILEAAVFGKPVVFGPIYDKYLEADELIAEGGAISISNALELEEVFNRLFNHETEYKWRSDVAEKFVEIKAGATQKIFDYIQANRLLTN